MKAAEPVLKKTDLFSVLAVSSLFFLVCGCGKENKNAEVDQASKGASHSEQPMVNPAETNRLLDKAYLKSLQSAVTNQQTFLRARNQALAAMRLREREIRATMPSNVPPEKVSEALKKDEKFVVLQREVIRQEESLKKIAFQNKQMIQNRLRNEMQMKKSVSQKSEKVRPQDEGQKTKKPLLDRK